MPACQDSFVSSTFNYKSKEWHKCRKLHSEKPIFLNKENKKMEARFLDELNNKHIFAWIFIHIS